MSITIQSDRRTLIDKIFAMNWGMLFLATAIACIGFTALYSAAGGNFDPWASKQIVRFIFSTAIAIIIALIDIRFWYKTTWVIYALGMGLLLIVETMGHIGMGAQRWIDLGFMQLQPSEMMKIAVVMALARYFHAASLDDMRRIRFLIIPVIIIIAPVCLTLLQPDLGSSLMIIMAGGGMLFIAGAPIWMFLAVFALIGISIPIAWQFMHAYQKQRVMTFLNPESDPLGTGYHIMQSKIALGSGGMEGKGFLQGSQSHLNFLPEKQTDFIFTLWAEEWGFLGGIFLLALFGITFYYGIWIALGIKSNFGRSLVLGVMINFSIYVFVNIAMVMGLIPVVGKALPLISYGGTSMLAAMIGFGLIMSAHVHRDGRINRF